MEARDILSHLRTQTLGRTLRLHDEVDSTNLRAVAAIRTGCAVHGEVHMARRQTAGRGTGERSWDSASPDGLWATLVLLEGPPLPAPLSFWPALAIHDVLTREFAVPARLKWPNDVLVHARKIAGILVETTPTPDGGQGYAVGMGVNLLQTAFEGDLAGTATSLRMEIGLDVPPAAFLISLLEALEAWEERDLLDGFVKASRMLLRPLRAERDGTWITATPIGITKEGFLEVEREDGSLETWVSGGAVRIDPESLDQP